VISAKSTNFEVNFHWFWIKFDIILKTKCLSTHFLYFYHWIYWFSSYILDSNISIALLWHLITLDYWFISQYISLVVILFFYWRTVDHWPDCYWINFRWFGRNTFIHWNICFAIVQSLFCDRLIVSVETTLSVCIFLYFHLKLKFMLSCCYRPLIAREIGQTNSTRFWLNVLHAMKTS
jgi:hypothetical protein